MADTTTLETGTYPFEIEVTEFRGEDEISYTLSGRQNVVNDLDSPVGNRWSFDGLERLSPMENGVLWVRPNGTYVFYPEDEEEPGSFVTPWGYGSTLTLANNVYTLAHKWRTGCRQ